MLFIVVIALIFVVIIMIIVVVIIIIVNVAITFGDWSMIIWLLLILSLTLSFAIIYIDHHYCYYHYYFMFHSSTRYGASKKKKKRNEEKKDRLNWVTVKKAQCLFTLPFKRLNLCLGSNICSSSFVILTWRRGEPDQKGSNPSGMTRKGRKKPVQLKTIHESITKGTLTPSITQLTMKIINQNDTPQHRSPTDFNYISTVICPLQIDERNVTKEVILDPI